MTSKVIEGHKRSFVFPPSELEMSGQGAYEKVRNVLARRNCVQSYSVMYSGGKNFVVLWGSGCTLPGLMDYKEFIKMFGDKNADVDALALYKHE